MRRLAPAANTIQRLPASQRTRKHVNKFRNTIDLIVEAAQRNRALLVTYVHKATTDGPTPGYPVAPTTLPRARGAGTVEKASVVRTLIPRAFLLGRNDNLLCWCSDVTDYEGAGLVSDPDVVHVKHFLVRNMTVIRLTSKPAGHAQVTFDMISTHLSDAARQAPDQYM